MTAVEAILALDIGATHSNAAIFDLRSLLLGLAGFRCSRPDEDYNEPDCNIPGGESFVRQALYAQRYFME